MTRYFFLLAFATLFFTSCGNAPEGEKVSSEEAVEVKDQPAETATTYSVDVAASQIDWIGSKFTGDQHNGYLKLSSGSLNVENGNIVGGSFLVDMNSLTDTDLDESSGKGKLEGHLKSADFFDAGQFPTGKFEIASVAAVEGNPDATHEITGNLTLKDVTKSITIPAKVEMSDSGISATTPQFTINRTEWNVKYGSGILGVAQDKAINDDVALKINLVASK
jgi:polyisoprenoid-binding protein YceI